MLKKLFGYECRAMGRLLLPLYGALIAMGAVSAVLLRLMPAGGEGAAAVPMTILSVISIMLLVLLVIATLVGSELFSVYRFWKNLFTQEGYLMHTLPVKPWQHVGSKLLAAVVFQVLSLIVAGAAGLVFLLVGATVPFGAFVGELGELIKLVAIHLGQEPAYLAIGAELLVLAVVGLASSTLQFYAAVSIGCSGGRHKLLRAVGVYVLFYIGVNVIQGVGLSALPNLGSADPVVRVHQLFLSTAALHAMLGALYFWLSSRFMSRRLNLN